MRRRREHVRRIPRIPQQPAVLRVAEQVGAHTVRLQDGIQRANHDHWTPLLEGQANLYGPGPCEGGVDLLCLWCDALADQLRRIGVKAHIEVTGNIQLDRLVGVTRRKVSGPPYRILLAHQCFSQLGAMWPSQELAAFDRISRILLDRPDVHLVFKPHPQTHQLMANLLSQLSRIAPDRFEFVNKTPIYELLQSVDGVVTISSSTSVESAALDIPTARLVHYLSTSNIRVFFGFEKTFNDKGRYPVFP